MSLHGQCLAAVLSCGPRALLSHASAAWLWGVSPRSPSPFQVVVPTDRTSKPSLIIRRSRALTEEDRALRDGIPVTALPRTLLDVAATFRFDRLQRAIERAEELQLFDLGAVEALLARTHGHPGTGRLRRAIALYLPPIFTRSGLERRFLELVEKAGLPQPATGFNEAGYELDAYWPRERFAVELDTFETHGSREAFERDRRRQEDLKLVGVEMMRITDHRLDREPEAVIERLIRLLDQRRGAGPSVR